MNTKLTIVAIVAILVGAAAGYTYGAKISYTNGDAMGYARAQVDFKKLQEAAAAKAAREAAQAANPFQAPNPLQGVQTNPFEKTKNILNPFR